MFVLQKLSIFGVSAILFVVSTYFPLKRILNNNASMNYSEQCYDNDKFGVSRSKSVFANSTSLPFETQDSTLDNISGYNNTNTTIFTVNNEFVPLNGSKFNQNTEKTTNSNGVMNSDNDTSHNNGVNVRNTSIANKDNHLSTSVPKIQTNTAKSVDFTKDLNTHTLPNPTSTDKSIDSADIYPSTIIINPNILPQTTENTENNTLSTLFSPKINTDDDLVEEKNTSFTKALQSTVEPLKNTNNDVVINTTEQDDIKHFNTHDIEKTSFGSNSITLQPDSDEFKKQLDDINETMLLEYLGPESGFNNSTFLAMPTNENPKNDFAYNNKDFQLWLIFIYTRYPILIENTNLLGFMESFESEFFTESNKKMLLYSILKKYSKESPLIKHLGTKNDNFCDQVKEQYSKIAEYLGFNSVDFSNMKDFRALYIELLYYKNICQKFVALKMNDPKYTKKLHEKINESKDDLMKDMRKIKPDLTEKELDLSIKVYFPKILKVLVDNNLLNEKVGQDITRLLKNDEQKQFDNNFSGTAKAKKVK